MRRERNAVDRELARDPSLVGERVRRHPRALIDATGRGNARGVELLARVGYDVNRREGHRRLHLAALSGRWRLRPVACGCAHLAP
jgi:hypothetical protein